MSRLEKVVTLALFFAPKLPPPREGPEFSQTEGVSAGTRGRSVSKPTLVPWVRPGSAVEGHLLSSLLGSPNVEVAPTQGPSFSGSFEELTSRVCITDGGFRVEAEHRSEVERVGPVDEGLFKLTVDA